MLARNMAGAFEQPLFFSSAMITTSSRLQHLDSHFSLHARLSSCRQATSRPHINHIQSSPSLLLSPPLKTVKRSASRSSNSSDATSFQTAVSKVEEEGIPQNKAASLPTDQSQAVTEIGNVQPAPRTANEPKTQNDSCSEPTLPVTSIPIVEPLKELPEPSSVTSHREGSRRLLDQRRISTISEPLPRSAIPRRTSSTAHKRHRRGQDLISFHRDSCRLFQSLEGTLSANRQEIRPGATRHYSMPGSRSPSFDEPLDRPTIQKPSRTLEERVEYQAGTNGGGEIPEHVDVASTTSLHESSGVEDKVAAMGPTAATLMSWTAAETRQREYEKIDQAHSGLRGLWKKLTPKWCHGRNSRRKFFEGKCDGDSVRR